jgi:hypothetical protein
LIDFGDLPVFKKATTYPCVLRIQKRQEPLEEFAAVNVLNLDFHDLNETVSASKFIVKKSALEHIGWSLVDEKTQALLKKLKSKGVPLGEYVNGKIYYGIKTGLNEAFVIDKETRDRLIHNDPKSREIIKPFLLGRDIKRYQRPKSDKYLILIPKGWTNLHKGNAKNPWLWLNESYPAIANHLNPFSVKAERRCDKGDYWWELRTCDYYEEFEKPKIIYPNICKQPEFAYDNNQLYTNQKCFIISLENKYLLALLNSKVTNFMFKMMLPKLRGDFYEPSYVYFRTFPIPICDYQNVKLVEEAGNKSIIDLVDQIISLNQQLSVSSSSAEKRSILYHIKAIDRIIDKLVYELYGLTNDEIQLIENEGG